MAESKLIKLVSNDGAVFTVETQVANCSKTIKTMLEDLGIGENEEIPLPNVNSATLKKVIEWATHHKDDPVPEEDEDQRDKQDELFSTWDADFFRIDQETLFELVLAANYLDISGLLDSTCKVIANMLRGKTAQECRKLFGIQNDFTPEEEEQIRRENEWCEDK